MSEKPGALRGQAGLSIHTRPAQQRLRGRNATRDKPAIIGQGERSLQKFVSIHAAVHNHFNKDRHLNSSNPFKAARTAALTAWRHAGEPLELGSAQGTFSNHGRVTHGQSPWAAHLPAVRGGVSWRQSVKAKNASS